MSALTLAVASAACAPHRVAAQDATPARPPAETAAPSEPVAPRQPATGPAAISRVEAELRAMMAQVRAKEAELRAASHTVAPGNFQVVRTLSSDGPLILTTRELDDAAAAEMKEDLRVMDKLVRDEIARAGGEDPDRPWGIKLTMVGRFAAYIEGGGAVFSTAVNFPLLAVPGGATAQQGGKPREPDSKWAITKRQMDGGNGLLEVRPGGKVQPPPFDPAKLEALRAAVVGLLPEAKNFRHLAENESVFVTIGGIDDAGGPTRMTFKALKKDIDAAAAGTLGAEEFAKRVTQRIG
jgi:hypothetical protein